MIDWTPQLSSFSPPSRILTFLAILIPLPAGGYCPIGSSYPQACKAGTYNNFSGASTPADCSDCPPGFYCSGTSNPAPTGKCAAGYYCSGGANDSYQHAVDPGYYSNEGASAQYPCLPGTYSNEASQSEDACFSWLSIRQLLSILNLTSNAI